MTTLIWKKDFLGSLLIEDELIPNKYTVELELVPNTNHVEQQGIALDRLHCFHDACLHSSVFASITNEYLEEVMKVLKNNVVFLPDDPYDQLIVIVLHSKLSAILEQRFFIDKLKLQSEQGNDLVYMFDSEMHEYPPVITNDIMDKEKAWWARPDMSSFDLITEEEDGTRILHKQELDWSDIELGWDSKQKEAEIITVKKFRPQVVEGKPNGSDDKESQ